MGLLKLPTDDLAFLGTGWNRAGGRPIALWQDQVRLPGQCQHVPVTKFSLLSK